GKTTYAKSSLINTVLYHSVFEATDDTKGTNRRLMVAGVYPRHEFEGVKYGGFAYYGEPTSEDPNLTKPFEDQAAEELWAKVQDLFEVDAPRTETQTGTDILILMDCLDLEALKKAVEDYYFPALIRNELSVTFHDEDGFRSTPKVLDREDLDQFIKLYKHAQDCEKERSEGFEAAALNKLNDHNLGCFAFQSAEPDEAASKKNNCVALMRGTGMVVNYVKFGSDQYEPAVGVFVAHDDIWKYLIASENAAHSEWNDMQRRLDENYPKLGPQIVKAVNDRVKKRFESFQHQLQPDVSVSRTESGLLARLLSGALSGSKGDKGPVKNFHNPVGIHLKQKKREENRSVWRLQIHENEHTPQASFPLALYPSISIAGEKWVALKHRDFKIKDLKGKILKNESQPELNFTFSKGETIDLLVELGNPGRQNYVVQCKCVADIPEESE
ncbi:MAG: hypothetical protein JAY72_12490, partial [Candidatus Thiodiazotropha endolucinida]|nr:hypothetical protein [Candidatus Thiodiazotropha taylori]MCW4322494.1 hypothetical protein [Candidatus Thiodiazotropha taylori]